MPKKSDVVRLRHMLDAAEKAINFTKGIRRAELDQDEKLALALVRLIEIIGKLQRRSRQSSRPGPGPSHGMRLSARATG